MKILTFRHSGNCGDIIYSLSAIKAACIDNAASAVLYIRLGVPSTFTEKTHPVGNVMMNRGMYDMLRPLLIAQPYIQDVQVYDNELVDYDLDLFRKECRNLSAGNIQSWYSSAYVDLRPRLHEPNLFVTPIKNDYIIINRTARYNNVFVDYSILRNYEDVYFVGVSTEFSSMALHNKNLKHLKVKDFHELAQYIAGCKLFIGNQSMAFAMAEQLKVRRILEQYCAAPNVIPEGGEYYVTQTAEQFKKCLLLCLHGKDTDPHKAESASEIGQPYKTQ
jgi:hypothetical protein